MVTLEKIYSGFDRQLQIVSFTRFRDQLHERTVGTLSSDADQGLLNELTELRQRLDNATRLTEPLRQQAEQGQRELADLRH